MKSGFVSKLWSGHLNPMTVLGPRLQSRGSQEVAEVSEEQTSP